MSRCDNEYIGILLNFYQTNVIKLVDEKKIENISDSLDYSDRQLIISDNINKIFEFNKRYTVFRWRLAT
jgi:hypothetical protein